MSIFHATLLAKDCMLLMPVMAQVIKMNYNMLIYNSGELSESSIIIHKVWLG